MCCHKNRIKYLVRSRTILSVLYNYRLKKKQVDWSNRTAERTLEWRLENVRNSREIRR